jgi:hypothetical protein
MLSRLEGAHSKRTRRPYEDWNIVSAIQTLMDGPVFCLRQVDLLQQPVMDEAERYVV